MKIVKIEIKLIFIDNNLKEIVFIQVIFKEQQQIFMI